MGASTKQLVFNSLFWSYQSKGMQQSRVLSSYREDYIRFHSEIQDKRKKVQDLSAARDIDSEATVRRLKESETRLRADVGASSATNDALRARLIENNDPEYRRLLVLQV